jgi:lipid-A-disaccharide synthase-like uncharacterized protein
MIHVPMWLFVLTLTAKVLTVAKGAWQAYCTRRKGYVTFPLSFFIAGIITGSIGLLYYTWMREPVGILGHVWTISLCAYNAVYKVTYDS